MDMQTSMLADEQLATLPSPLEFPSRRHAFLTVAAIEDRAATIESLAKKADDEGYHRIARELKADALMLKEDVLPKIREQQELALAGPEEATNAIASYIADTIRYGLKDKDNPEAFIDRVASRLERAFEAVYEIGFAVGTSRRLDDPAYAIVRACFKAANRADD
jgi:hypothetical protein